MVNVIIRFKPSVNLGTKAITLSNLKSEMKSEMVINFNIIKTRLDITLFQTVVLLSSSVVMKLEFINQTSLEFTRLFMVKQYMQESLVGWN